MARKKIIFVMVEGPSDGDSLGVLLNRLYKDEAVYIHVMHCDITTKNGVNATNIYTKVGDEVKEYAKLNKFKDSDFKEIIHIVDTDGAYIPDESIVEDKTHQQAFYTCSQILIDHPKAVCRHRNRIVDVYSGGRSFCSAGLYQLPWYDRREIPVGMASLGAVGAPPA